MEEGDGRENDPMTKKWRKCSQWESVVMDAMKIFDEEEKVSEMVRPGKEEESKEEESKEEEESTKEQVQRPERIASNNGSATVWHVHPSKKLVE